MVTIRKSLAALAFFALPVLPAQAECIGQNLLDQMDPSKRAELQAMVDAQPFPKGNFWQAERDGQSLTLIGTYHLEDPRHAPVTQQFAPIIEAADLLLVEAGPEEQKALVDHLGRDPSLMVITDGPALNQQVSPETWERLSAAAEARGIPPFMAAKFRPWYLSMLLAIPPCAMEAMQAPNGLDQQLITAAEAAGTPIQALEPYDTLFSIFEVFTPEQQLAMVEQTLAYEDQILDFSHTLADAYFTGDSRLIWEMMRVMAADIPGYTKERADAEAALVEEALMIRRNKAWIPVIEAAAAKGKTVAAFGALHLPGKDGVLDLLAQNGWTITPIAAAAP